MRGGLWPRGGGGGGGWGLQAACNGVLSPAGPRAKGQGSCGPTGFRRSPPFDWGISETILQFSKLQRVSECAWECAGRKPPQMGVPQTSPRPTLLSASAFICIFV